MGRPLRFLKTAGPARPALFLACVAAHAALVAAFWSGTPLRASARPVPALVLALPATGEVSAAPATVVRQTVPTPSASIALPPSGPPASGESAGDAAAAGHGLALGEAAIARAMQAPAVLRPGDTPQTAAPVRSLPDSASAPGEPDHAETAAAPPPAARALPAPPRRADLQLAYHRMRVAQDAMRLHQAQGEHLAWLQRRVTALLASAADPDAMPEGARCTARVEEARLSVRCDDPALGGRIERADGDLAVFLARLIMLTAPGGEVEIAFLPAQPPVVAAL